MRIGQHVYDVAAQANGVVTAIDNMRNRRNVRVEYHWAKYSTIDNGSWVDKPKERGTKWQWCNSDDLVILDMAKGQNVVRSTGKRSLDRLIRRQVGIKPWGVGKYHADILLRYGDMSYNRRNDTRLIINETITNDKFRQCQIMGEDLTPMVTKHVGPAMNTEDWICKPYRSMGGKNIYRLGGVYNPQTHYLQRMFNKVREFRVHCFLWMDNPVPFIQEKIIRDKNQLTWNKKQGGMFRYVYQEGLDYGKFHGDCSMANRNIMAHMAIDACKKLHMDFAGIDFGMDVNGNFKIFEANSRMGLRERSLFTYKQAINALTRIDINQYKQKRGW